VYEFVNSVTLWGDHVVPITPQNIENKAIILVDQYKKKAALFKTGDNVLVPLGKSAHTHTRTRSFVQRKTRIYFKKRTTKFTLASLSI
jgi:hypothetical protein